MAIRNHTRDLVCQEQLYSEDLKCFCGLNQECPMCGPFVALEIILFGP